MRLVGYLWASPVTLLGLLLGLLVALSGGSVRLRGGVVEAYGGLAGRLLRGGRLRRGGAAMALGHVILARDAGCLARSRGHELAHVRQFERWGRCSRRCTGWWARGCGGGGITHTWITRWSRRRGDPRHRRGEPDPGPWGPCRVRVYDGGIGPAVAVRAANGASAR